MKKIFSILLIVSCFTANAQYSFQFLPELHGRSMDGLFQVKIINSTTSTALAKLTITVNAKGNGNVVKIVSGAITINPGLNNLGPSIASNAYIQFSQSELSRIVRQSNLFPEAEYAYCFRLEDQKSANLFGEECFDYILEPFSPLSLVEPFNMQEMCEKKPGFVWQPIFPSILGLQYQLTLAEVKEKQSPTEALFYNVPIINLRNLFSSFLPYPSIAKNLDSAKKYVWQVTAYKGDMVISRSEIWTFKIVCTTDVITNPNNGYRNIEDLVMGNFYVANERILFSMDNPYTEKNLEYSIVCLTDPEMKIKKLSTIKLDRGKNNIMIPLENKRIFKEGYSYIMKVKLPNGTERTLRFIYKEN
jgi:hypothetical protein